MEDIEKMSDEEELELGGQRNALGIRGSDVFLKGELELGGQRNALGIGGSDVL